MKSGGIVRAADRAPVDLSTAQIVAAVGRGVDPFAGGPARPSGAADTAYSIAVSPSRPATTFRSSGVLTAPNAKAALASRSDRCCEAAATTIERLYCTPGGLEKGCEVLADLCISACDL